MNSPPRSACALHIRRDIGTMTLYIRHCILNRKGGERAGKRRRARRFGVAFMAGG